ncbi:MAG TPA: CPBP family intramembrane glutamic endopeptidase [Mucilaginibacter sp.]|jgi:membrane protease YdiL (CAAX protease family)|nr:CPBP family intramembrane glutamic endopeptidase [Mucilaginibacter sp.]
MTDGPYNPIPHRQIHPGLQFITVIGLLILALIVGSFFAMTIIGIRYGTQTLTDILQTNLTAPNVSVSLWILQFFGTTMPILATPIIFSYFIAHERDEYLKTNFHFPWLLMVIVFVAMMLSNPLIEFLGNLNEKMVLPKFLKGMEDWMRQSENDTKKLSDAMMTMNTFWNMVFNLLFIGLLTAVVEEVLFRGCLQTIFVRWTKNKHVAVWVVAILFSAFHMEFFGFLPRMLLGVLFGYFTAWSGSVWPSVWGHFVNNGTIVVITYLAQQKLVNIDVDDQHMFSNGIYTASLIVTVVLLYFYHYIAVKRQIADHGEELG